MKEKIEAHKRNLELRKKNLEDWKIPKIEKKNLIKFLEDLGLGKVNKGIKVSERRQLKYLDLLRPSLIYLKKPVKKLELKDIENFEKDLTSDKIQTYKNKPYKKSTKADLKRVLKIYLKWNLGNTQKFQKLTDWLDLRVPKKTPDYLKESEVLKLYKSCKSNAERYLIAVLFDSGARIEEFLNIRYEDIQLPDKNQNFAKITLKEEYSKTKGRVVSLYWSESLGAVIDFLKEREEEGITSEDPIYTKNYDALRVWLNRFGKKILKKNIYPHLFRHSSSTFYASKLNRQELCYRYGWAFSSDMVDVYISRAGMETKELDGKFGNEQLGELKQELSKEKFEKAKFEEQLLKLSENQHNLMAGIQYLMTKDIEKKKSYEEVLILEKIKSNLGEV